MIHGVSIKQLTIHADERGMFTELLREDEEVFTRFGQANFSLNYPGVVRAWHWHSLQDDLWVVVRGMIKAVLYDPREGSPTKGEVQEVFMGEQNPVLVKIPIGVIHGYKTIGVDPSALIYFVTKAYSRDDPDEYRLPWNTGEIPYDWDITFR
ncbi:MAG: dTDP-4-dehydrorhamnose 3,5 epimerase [Dehalococcoidia bacterium]|nr:dTDP-4-dehydrorhamnose 3,5 epimerase [Dehalococcoidia bacterium]